MSKVFITFGGGNGRDNLEHHSNIKEACKRLIAQADEIKLFDKTIGYTDEYLKSDIDFWNQNNNFIKLNKKGYGYWLWKPYIIKKTMENMKNGDILLYADAGCEINKNFPEKMVELFNYVGKNKILFMGTGFMESQYTKKDLFVELDIYNQECGNTQQRAATTIMFLVTEETRQLVDKWYELGCIYHLIDDSPSNSNVANITMVRNFSEHRHDQSIFSLLTKKNNYKYLDVITGNPSICTKRNRTGISLLK